MRFKTVIAILAAAPVVLLAFSTGPPVRRTGAAVDGGVNCSVCHVTYAPANSDPTGSVSIAFDTPAYTPGITQMVHVTVQHPQAQRWGFQLSARPVGAQTKEAGTFSATSVVRVRCDTTPAQDAPCNGALEFAEHSNAPRTAVGAGYTFDVPWTPPATDAGDVIFYFSGNAANGDGTLLGDRIYTNAKTISSVNACNSAPAAKPVVTSLVNGASGLAQWSANSSLSIFGAGFAAAGLTRAVSPGDLSANAYPQQLSCIAVEINGQRVPITYVQGNQINLQAPTVVPTGSASVTVVVNPGLATETRSAALTVSTVQAVAPAFFTLNGTSIAALSTSGTIVANAAVIAAGQAAKPGDTVSLYGTGFGTTTPAFSSGAIVSGQASVATPVSVTLNGAALPASAVLYAGLSPGSISCVYQINVTIPANTPSGDIPVTVTVGGVTSPAGTTIPVKSSQ